MGTMERRRCWFVPMRPVTPFMMMPIRRVVIARSLLDDLRNCTRRKRRRWRDACTRECAIKFLTPVRNIAGGTVNVEHSGGSGANVGELVENTGRNENGLASLQNRLLGAKAHFARAFENKINLFLLLIVPGHLT